MQTLYRVDEKEDSVLAIDACHGTHLQKIIQKARFLLSLDHLVQSLLPPEFAKHCHVMNVQNGRVILGVENAAMGTRLQFLNDDLVRSIQRNQKFSAIHAIKYVVQPVRSY